MFLPDVSCPNKGWQIEACDKPNKPQPVSEDRALQDGRHPHAERPAESRRLDGQDRHERCILHGTHGKGGPTLPQVPLGRQVLPVQLPALRAVLSSVGLYEDHTASCGNLAGVGTTSNNLHLRHPRHGGDRDSPNRPYHSSYIPAGESGVCDQPLQVRANPHPGNRISRVYSQLHQGRRSRRSEQRQARPCNHTRYWL